MDVRCQNGGQRQEVYSEIDDGSIWKQLRSTCCDDDGVKDNDKFLTFVQSLCHCINSPWRSQHANFDNIDTNVIHAGVYLCNDNIGRHMEKAMNTLSILRSQSGGCGHGIAPVSSNHFLVGFESTVLILATKSRLGRRSRLTLLLSCLSQQ